jgi:hypothetical protein
MGRRAIAWIVLIGLAPLGVEASRVLPMNLPQLVEDAGKIFLGKCIEVRSGKDPDTGLIVTWITFEVSKGIKGDPGETETIKQLGGTHEGLTVTSFTPTFRVGEEVLLFVYPASAVGLTSAVGLHQGKFNVYTEERTGKRKVTNGMPKNLLFAEEPAKVSKTRGYRIKGADDPIIAQAKSMELAPFIETVRTMIKETAKPERR